MSEVNKLAEIEYPSKYPVTTAKQDWTNDANIQRRIGFVKGYEKANEWISVDGMTKDKQKELIKIVHTLHETCLIECDEKDILLSAIITHPTKTIEK